MPPDFLFNLSNTPSSRLCEAILWTIPTLPARVTHDLDKSECDATKERNRITDRPRGLWINSIPTDSENNAPTWEYTPDGTRTIESHLNRIRGKWRTRLGSVRARAHHVAWKIGKVLNANAYQHWWRAMFAHTHIRATCATSPRGRANEVILYRELFREQTFSVVVQHRCRPPTALENSVPRTSVNRLRNLRPEISSPAVCVCVYKRVSHHTRTLLRNIYNYKLRNMIQGSNSLTLYAPT